ncbi:MAG: protease HtpX [Candidatus Binatia bacterium]|nr:MAG: protease HtpX [Candidatus Binatia bacterium]
MSNTLKTTFLLGLLTGVILAIGQFFGGTSGLVVAFVFAAVTNLGSYWFSDRIVLSMYGARPVTPDQAPELHATVRELCTQARLPLPRLYVIESPSPNAFATGRNPRHAAVAVTTGLLRILDERELRGVLAHELAHVRNRDILTCSIAATLAGAIMMLANMAQWAAFFGGMHRDRDNGGNVIALVLTAVLAPIAALLIQAAISRAREFQADATGARISGDPLALASALERLGQASRRLPLDAHPYTAHLFIVNPLEGNRLAGLFSTHPPLEERIARLRRMA